MRLCEINPYLWPVCYGLNVALQSPTGLLKETLQDFKNDYQANRTSLVWVAGLPKSGTTMIEQILSTCGFVQGNKSVLRRWKPYPLDHVHGICDGHFRFFPHGKKTFLKTHTHFDYKYMKIAEAYDVKILISIRDIRDMMISRYFHIMSDKRHWQHEVIFDLPPLEGFQLSCTEKKDLESLRPIDYYTYWISEWVKKAPEYDALVLQYEDYYLARDDYLNRIMSHIGADYKPSHIEACLQQTRDRAVDLSPDLSQRRKQAGRSVSTYRIGGTSWKEFFDKPTSDWFDGLVRDKNCYHSYV